VRACVRACMATITYTYIFNPVLFTRFSCKGYMKSREIFEFGAKGVKMCSVTGCKRIYFHIADLQAHEARHKKS
jgi:hypothetical protein